MTSLHMKDLEDMEKEVTYSIPVVLRISTYEELGEKDLEELIENMIAEINYNDFLHELIAIRTDGKYSIQIVRE